MAHDIPRQPRTPKWHGLNLTNDGVIKDGTLKHSSEIDFTGDIFERTHAQDPGFYIMFGFWKGPFDKAEDAKDAYREWVWEMKHS